MGPLGATSRDDVSEGIGLDWASSVRNVYQCFVGHLIDGDPTRLRAKVEWLHASLPSPSNRAESILLRQSLAMLMDRTARAFDQRFHANFSHRPCEASPPPENDAAWIDPQITIERLLDRWIAGYTTWFDRHHVLPPATQARRILEERFSEHHTIGSLARATGCSRTSLMLQFRTLFGLSPSEYLARLRVAQGIQRLRTPGVSADDAASYAGYQSANKFYARLKRHAGLRPSQVRALADAEFDRLVRTLLCSDFEA